MNVDYHFNEWAFLARTDPEAFERRRRAYIEQFLVRAGHRRPQLEALQATIDAECMLAADPQEALMTLCRMMSQSLAELHLAMTSLSGDLRRLRGLTGAVTGDRDAPCIGVSSVRISMAMPADFVRRRAPSFGSGRLST